MMQKLKLTTVTQLHEESNRCLIEYLNIWKLLVEIMVKHYELLSTQ